MKMSEQSRASIVSALKTALCRYASEGDETVVTDIHCNQTQKVVS